jgi:hypothetical protein
MVQCFLPQPRGVGKRRWIPTSGLLSVQALLVRRPALDERVRHTPSNVTAGNTCVSLRRSSRSLVYTTAPPLVAAYAITMASTVNLASTRSASIRSSARPALR